MYFVLTKTMKKDCSQTLFKKNSLFNHFFSNKLFTPSQTVFLTGDLCIIAQWLSIIHEIQINFDSNPHVGVRGVFLDISKAFDKVWHNGLLYKLKSYGIEVELLFLLECYLRGRKKRVVLNGQNSDWRRINSGVPQGSVLGSLLFLIYLIVEKRPVKCDQSFSDDQNFSPTNNFTRLKLTTTKNFYQLFFLLNKNQITENLKKNYQIYYTITWLSGVG